MNIRTISANGLNVSPVQYPSGHEPLKIYATRDYGMFRLDTANRPIRQRHVDELVELIRADNRLHLPKNAIEVDEHFKILDGQHRHQAAKRLNETLYYYIAPGKTIMQVVEENAGTAKWSGKDYLHHYCEQGLAPYIWLRDFLKRYPFMALSDIVRLTGDWSGMGDGKGVSRGTRMRKAYESGRYVNARAELAERAARAVLDYKAAGVKDAERGSLVRAVSNLVQNPAYDHRRMMGKLEYLSTRLVKCYTVTEYLQVIDGIYNFNAKPGGRVDLTDGNQSSRGRG